MSSTDVYTESFVDRGSKYDQAMKQVPDSRREEFMAVVEEISGLEHGLVLDVPAGGAYLRKYLPARFDYQPYEPVGAFKGSTGVESKQGLLPFPQPSAIADIVVSVAGVHHFNDKKPLFTEMARVTKPGGKLILADVHHQSNTAQFLDGYIDANNSTGHSGFFLGENTLNELDECGWNVNSADRKYYYWIFASRQQLARYCHLLFDITHNDYHLTLEQIEQELGIDSLPDNRIGMCWDLFVINAQKKR